MSEIIGVSASKDIVGEGAHRDDDQTGDGTPDDKGETAPPPTLVVWAARLFSLAAIGAIVGYLLYLIFVRPSVPAQFDVELLFDEAVERNGSWVLPVDVVNTSTNAVSDLVVEVVMNEGQDDEAVRSTTISLMGEGETIEAEMLFPDRPTPANTTSSVLGYQSP